MEENIYVLYDIEAQIGLKPFIVSRNDVQPIREVQELVNNEQLMFKRHPQHFHLVQVGTIDLETLKVTPTSSRTVARLDELLARPAEGS